MKLRFTFVILVVVSQYAFLSPRVNAHPATGVVVDRSGNVYFSDLEAIWKLDAHGNLTVFRPGLRGRHVHELSIDEQGNIYGSDVGYNPSTKRWPTNVWKMTPAGEFSQLLPTTENPPPGWSIWRDRDGNMYSIDQNNHTKTETLLLKRGPDGAITRFAGGSYGHADGKGTAARFSSVGGFAFGPDGALYLTDGAFVRKVTMDGTVSTLASDLTRPSLEDNQRLFGGSDGDLTGLAVDSSGNIYVADAGNRRLLKISPHGKVEVILRSGPPYFPNGVAVADRTLFVLEVGFTLPSAWSGPRIRKINLDGESTILGTVGREGVRSSLATKTGLAVESTLAFFYNEGRLKYTFAVFVMVGISLIAFIWQRRRSRA